MQYDVPLPQASLIRVGISLLYLTLTVATIPTKRHHLELGLTTMQSRKNRSVSPPLIFAKSLNSSSETSSNVCLCVYKHKTSYPEEAADAI